MSTTTTVPRLALSLMLGFSLLACESAAPSVAPARPLYRLGLGEVFTPPTADATSAPQRTETVRTSRDAPTHAYTIAVRLERLPVLGVAVQKIEGSETLSAPRLTVYPDQRANIAVIDQQAFIQDFDVEVLADGLYVADPIVGVLQNGLTIDLLVRDVDGDRVRLGYAVEMADCGERHPERELLLRTNGTPVTIQLPAVEVRRVAGARETSLGTEVELFDWPDADGGHVRAMATITRVDLHDDGSDVRLAYIRDDIDVEAPTDDPAPAFRSQTFEGLDLRELATHAAGRDGRTELQFVLLESRDSATELGRALPLSGPSAIETDGAEVLDRVVWSTELVPGSRYEARLLESYVSDRIPTGTGSAAVEDPRIATLTSGVSAVAAADGSLRVEWVTTPAWTAAEVSAGEVDRPVSRITGAIVPVTAEGVFVPLARTHDGRLAGVTVIGSDREAASSPDWR